MSFDLFGAGAGNAGSHVKFNDGEWIKLLELAETYGWERAGTGPPPRVVFSGCWDGNYDTNSFQRVGEKDARDLAAAVERGLPDVPDVEVARKMRVYRPEAGEEGLPAHPRLRRSVADAFEAARKVGADTIAGADDSLSPFEFLSGEKRRLRYFVRLARSGPFVIG